MVNRGRSKGCGNCRARHVKCGEERPVCRNCVRLKQRCPGYDDIFDRMHKSENESVERRVVSQQQAVFVGRSTGGSTKRPPMQVLATLHAGQSSCTSASYGPLSANPSPPPETWAISIWFNFYQQDCTDAFGEHMQSLYGYSSLDSPLRPAVTALALGTSLYWMTGNFDVPIVWKFHVKAIRSLQEALRNSQRSIQDDVLMAALVLDLAEGLQHQFLPEGSSGGGHRNGAVALLALRGRLNQRDEGSKSMTSTLRTWVVNDAMARGVSINQPLGLQDQEEELGLPSNQVSRLCISNQLTKLCYRVLDIQTRYEDGLKRSTPNNLESTKELLLDALTLDSELLAWQDSLSGLHRPAYASAADMTQSIQEQSVYGPYVAVFASLGVSDMYCKFNLLQLRLMDIIMRLEATPSTEEVSAAALLSSDTDINVSIPSRMLLCIDDIMSSVAFYIGDISEPTNPLLAHEVAFPWTPTEFGTFPLDYKRHSKRAIAAACVSFISVLATMLRFMESDECLGTRPYDLGVEEAQIQWVKGQMERIKRIFRIRAPSREVLEQWCHD